MGRVSVPVKPLLESNAPEKHRSWRRPFPLSGPHQRKPGGMRSSLLSRKPLHSKHTKASKNSNLRKLRFDLLCSYRQNPILFQKILEDPLEILLLAFMPETLPMLQALAFFHAERRKEGHGKVGQVSDKRICHIIGCSICTRSSRQVEPRLFFSPFVKVIHLLARSYFFFWDLFQACSERREFELCWGGSSESTYRVSRAGIVCYSYVQIGGCLDSIHY